MLPEVGGLEWLIIAVVALIVIGPKDLPVMMRRVGEFVGKLRGMAADFRASFDEMARQSELDELRKEVEAMRRGQFSDIAAQAGEAEIQAAVGEIEQHMADVGVQLHPPMSYQYDELGQSTPPAPLTIEEGPKPEKKPRAPRKPKAQTEAAPKRAAVARKQTPLVEGGPKRKKPLVEGGR